MTITTPETRPGTPAPITHRHPATLAFRLFRTHHRQHRVRPPRPHQRMAPQSRTHESRPHPGTPSVTALCPLGHHPRLIDPNSLGGIATITCIG